MGGSGQQLSRFVSRAGYSGFPPLSKDTCMGLGYLLGDSKLVDPDFTQCQLILSLDPKKILMD